jgi:methyltransferase-like protein
MNLRIKIPPYDTYVVLEDLLHLLQTNQTESMEKIIESIHEEYPRLFEHAYKQKICILHKAVKHNNYYATKALLEIPNAKQWMQLTDKKDMTPLMWAMKHENVDIVNLFLSKDEIACTKTIVQSLIHMDWWKYFF